MKKLVLFAMVLGFTASANAGSVRFICKDSKGSILLSRSNLVLKQSDDMTVLNNLTGNTTLLKGDIVEFGSTWSSKEKLGELKVTSSSERKTIDEDDGGDCKGGHGPGFLTEAYMIKGKLSLYSGQAENIELSCVETSTWGGNCDFDEE